MKELPTFYSWRTDPEAQGTDAFNQDWSKMRGFLDMVILKIVQQFIQTLLLRICL